MYVPANVSMARNFDLVSTLVRIINLSRPISVQTENPASERGRQKESAIGGAVAVPSELHPVRDS